MKVTIPRTELLKKLIENKEKHMKIFKEACEGYQEKMIDCLNDWIKKVKHNPTTTVYIKLNAPISHAEDYENAITLLEMSSDVSVELSETEAQTYIRDQWEWRASWSSTVNQYTKFNKA